MRADVASITWRGGRGARNTRTGSTLDRNSRAKYSCAMNRDWARTSLFIPISSHLKFQRATKHFLLLAPIIAVFAGCATGNCLRSSVNRGKPGSDEPVFSSLSNSSSTYVVHAIHARSDDTGPRVTFKVGEQQFVELEEFKAFIRSLPPGSIVWWDTGCLRHYKTIPLLPSDMTIQSFKDYCKENGVTFRYTSGW